MSAVLAAEGFSKTTVAFPASWKSIDWMDPQNACKSEAAFQRLFLNFRRR